MRPLLVAPLSPQAPAPLPASASPLPAGRRVELADPCSTRTVRRPATDCREKWCRATSSCFTNETLREQRRSSLSCLQSYKELNPDFGAANSRHWTEFDPRYCFELEGFTLPMAEPNNTLTGLAFDQLVCKTVTTTPIGQAITAPYWHEIASHLALGTVALHAAGQGDEPEHGIQYLPGRMDAVPMRCTLAVALREAMHRLGAMAPAAANGTAADAAAAAASATTAVHVAGNGTNATEAAEWEYDWEHLGAHCVREYSAAIRACKLHPVAAADSLAARVARLDAALPSMERLAALFGAGMIRSCYGADASSATLDALSEMAQLDCPAGPGCARVKAFSLAPLAPADTALLHASGFCIHGSVALAQFVGALRKRVGPHQAHDQWHLEAAEALKQIAVALFSIPEEQLSTRRRDGSKAAVAAWGAGVWAWARARAQSTRTGWYTLGGR